MSDQHTHQLNDDQVAEIMQHDSGRIELYFFTDPLGQGGGRCRVWFRGIAVDGLCRDILLEPGSHVQLTLYKLHPNGDLVTTGGDLAFHKVRGFWFLKGGEK